ncbi:Uncharacterized protein HZ326_24621 [Fusarium oxysporum f. sp. albedinis]|nr:Uncharacterized protein HZ326_24621 [Fusarium oxysporum f. sp. albedinis]
MLTWWADKPVTSQPWNARQPMIAHSCPCFRIAHLHLLVCDRCHCTPMPLCISYVVSCPLLSPCVRRSICRSLPCLLNRKGCCGCSRSSKPFLSLRQGFHQN